MKVWVFRVIRVLSVLEDIMRFCIYLLALTLVSTSSMAFGTGLEEKLLARWEELTPEEKEQVQAW